MLFSFKTSDGGRNSGKQQKQCNVLHQSPVREKRWKLLINLNIIFCDQSGRQKVTGWSAKMNK